MPPLNRRAGFTLIELLVVIAVAAIIVATSAPGFRRLILDQRLKSVNAQLVNDLQFARSEAAARNMHVYFSYRAVVNSMTCYTIYTTTVAGAYCNCTLGVGSACPNPAQTEIRTVQIPWNGTVRLTPGQAASDFAFDNITGGLVWGTVDAFSVTPTPFVLNSLVIGDASRTLRTTLSPSGRPTVCNAGATRISGFEPC